MYIIDQHAAHERLLYERIKDNYYSKSRETQMLLIPTLVELKNSEKELVENNKEMFEKAFFESYRQTGAVYHRSRLSLAMIYQDIMSKHYPDGIHKHRVVT